MEADFAHSFEDLTTNRPGPSGAAARSRR